MSPIAVKRYEVLPFGDVVARAGAVPRPLELTVTCSPRHGIDRTVEFAAALAALGHRVTPHLSARALRGATHLDVILGRLAAADVDEVFVIAGDDHQAAGPYASAVELLPAIAAHADRPRRLGIAGYPEGHPLIDDDELWDALCRKAVHADYVTTQMCFDAAVLAAWVGAARGKGIELPVYLGLPGQVDQRRLLQLSLRVGVGRSVALIRRQRGMRALLGRPRDAVDRIRTALIPMVGAAGLGIVGLQFFTFNRLAETLAWEREHAVAAEREPQAHV